MVIYWQWFPLKLFNQTWYVYRDGFGLLTGINVVSLPRFSPIDVSIKTLETCNAEDQHRSHV